MKDRGGGIGVDHMKIGLFLRVDSFSKINGYRINIDRIVTPTRCGCSYL